MKDTRDKAYTERLVHKDTWWKRLLDVQRPYRYNLRRLQLGHVLDIGCGLGRNLQNLTLLGVTAVGVDHNSHSVAECQARGHDALDAADFAQRYSKAEAVFDSFLVSHVLEHMTDAEAAQLLKDYLPLLKASGRVILITPQELGFASDPTHVAFTDFTALAKILQAAGLVAEQHYSFPLPRFMGRLFTHNEFVMVGARPNNKADTKPS